MVGNFISLSLKKLIKRVCGRPVGVRPILCDLVACYIHHAHPVNAQGHRADLRGVQNGRCEAEVEQGRGTAKWEEEQDATEVKGGREPRDAMHHRARRDAPSPLFVDAPCPALSAFDGGRKY